MFCNSNQGFFVKIYALNFLTKKGCPKRKIESQNPLNSSGIRYQPNYKKAICLGGKITGTGGSKAPSLTSTLCSFLSVYWYHTDGALGNAGNTCSYVKISWNQTSMSPESDILVSSTRGLCLLLKTCACNRGLFITTEVLDKRGRSFFLCKSPTIFLAWKKRTATLNCR